MVGIKGFKMPKDCQRCPCMIEVRVTYDEPYGCVFTRKTYNWGMKHRPSDCPLVEDDCEEDDGR